MKELGLSKKVSFAIIKGSFVPAFILLLFIAAYIFYKIEIQPVISAPLQQDLAKHIRTIFIVVIVFVMQRIGGSFLHWYAENICAKTKTKLDDKLVPIVRRFFKVLIWVIALVIILPFYGVNISALIATLGVASLAIALAAQDTIANIIAGFLIMLDSPFRIGDKIKLPSGEIVEVLDIEIRRSKFLSEDKKAIIIVPNLDLSKTKIVNFTYAEELAR